MGYYAAYGGNSLLMFWDNILFPSSYVKKSKKKGFEICAFLRYDTAYRGDSLPTFWEKLPVPSLGSRKSERKDFLIPEDSTDSADLSWLSYFLPLSKLECVTAFTRSTVCSYTKQVNAIHIFSPFPVVSLFLHLCLDHIQDDACLCIRRLLAWKDLICLAPNWVLLYITVHQNTFPAASCCAWLPTLLSWSYTV